MDLNWNALADEPVLGPTECPTTYSIQFCSDTVTGCTPDTALPNGTGISGTSVSHTGVAQFTYYNYTITGAYGGIRGPTSSPVEVYIIPTPPPYFSTVAFEAQPLINTDSDITGTVSDPNLGQSLTDLTITPFICLGTICDQVIELTDQAVHPNTSGQFTVTIPGSYIQEDVPLRFALKAEDDNGLMGCYAYSIGSTYTYFATCNDAELKDENNWTWWVDPPTPPDQPLQFLEPIQASEYPFDPTDGEGLGIWFRLNASAQVSARIYTMKGRLVRTLYNNVTELSDTNEGCNSYYGCHWNGTDQGGRMLPSGMYIFHLMAQCGDQCPSYITTTSLELTKGIVIMK